jgi:peptidyl-Lys metalloendopeptidase
LSNILYKLKFLLPIFIFLGTFLTADMLSISFPKAKQNNNGTLTLSLTNSSNSDVKILKWNTPFEKTLSADIFHVEYKNKIIAYIGRRMKRSKPTTNDYITLQAGESRVIDIDLSAYYNMQEQGTYTVSYKGYLAFKSLVNHKSSKQFTTTPNIKIYYTPKKEKASLRKIIGRFIGCSHNESIILNQAHDNAIVLAKESSDTINASSANISADRYHTWFGSKDSQRHATVKTHLNNIYQALNTERISFDCTCNESSFAYVYDTQPYTIYVCNGFWSASALGIDSQAGTLVHEMAHFNIIANTEDHAYGQNDAKILAISNPNDAIYNSDNHEYFTENLPILSMDNIYLKAQNINLLTDIPLYAAIDVSNKKDIFSFVAPTSGIYTFSSAGSLDMQGALYNLTDETLYYNDDAPNTLNFQFKYYLLAGNRYYLSVNVFGAKTGAYTLNVTLPTVKNTDAIKNFVTRFYTQVLNRNPDQKGLDSWIYQLASGEKAGADIAKGFIFSNEFQNRHTNDVTYLTILYKAFFGRAPDTGGLNIWLNKLATGSSRAEVLDGFLFSKEFENLSNSFGIQVNKDLKGFVQRFYQAILGRKADEEGLNNWVNSLASKEKAGADIARGFIFSGEYINKKTDDISFVTTLYQAFFGRTPDSGGLKIWIDKLNLGAKRTEILDGFLYSQEFANLCQSYGIVPIK